MTIPPDIAAVPDPMKIVVAPNAFKGCLGADEVASAIGRGLDASPLRCRTVRHPVADGGDGTGQVLAASLGAEWITVQSCDPLGRPLKSRIALAGNGRAVIELADTAGLKLLRYDEYDPFVATTYGTGLAIRAALDAGAREIFLGLGGSATVDGGIGLLSALGARFIADDGQQICSARGLHDLAAIDLKTFDPRLAETRLTLLCDVQNPLLGERGAAAVFGPQKGITPEQVPFFEHGLARLAALIFELTGQDISALARGGAAGGISASLHALATASLESGIDLVLNLTDFDSVLIDADLVITGEGAIDSQTLQGKASAGVAMRARARNIPVIAVTGSVPLPADPALLDIFTAAVSITNRPCELGQALAACAANLERVGRDLGALWATARQAP